MNLLAIIMVIITTISCANTSSNSEEQNGNVTISGNLENGKDKQLILMRLTLNQPAMIDTVVADETGEFKLITNINNIGFYRLASSQKNGAILIIKPGETIELSGNADDMLSGLKVKGSKDTQLMWDYIARSREFGDYIQKLKGQIAKLSPDQDAEKQKLIEEYNTSNDEFNEFSKQFIKDNSSSPAVLPALGSLNMETDIDYFIMVRDGLKPSFSTSPFYKDLDNTIAQYESNKNKMNSISPGNQAPDIVLNDPQGKSHSLSSLKGHVVLIDFWASWCRPCRAENPNVVRLYKKYHGDGFEIFSVSLDKTKDRWEKAIADDGLLWQNHVSDLMGWKSAGAQLYNVTGIPFTVLVDEEGKIITTNLRGPSLEAKLKEIYGH